MAFPWRLFYFMQVHRVLGQDLWGDKVMDFASWEGTNEVVFGKSEQVLYEDWRQSINKCWSWAVCTLYGGDMKKPFQRTSKLQLNLFSIVFKPFHVSNIWVSKRSVSIFGVQSRKIYNDKFHKNISRRQVDNLNIWYYSHKRTIQDRRHWSWGRMYDRHQVQRQDGTRTLQLIRGNNQLALVMWAILGW